MLSTADRHRIDHMRADADALLADHPCGEVSPDAECRVARHVIALADWIAELDEQCSAFTDLANAAERVGRAVGVHPAVGDDGDAELGKSYLHLCVTLAVTKARTGLTIQSSPEAAPCPDGLPAPGG